MPAIELDYDESEQEAAPFLDPEVDDDALPIHQRRRRLWYQPASSTGVVGLITLMLFLLTLSGTIALLPMARIIEDTICRKHYHSTEPVDEEKCKVDEVQAEFAWIGGLQALVTAIMGFLVSFPYGVLSDSLFIGGGWMMFVLSQWETLPLWLMVLGPISSIFGGGISVLIAVMHSFIADVTTERASGFLFLSLGAVIGSVAGPSISAQMMERWDPMVPLTLVGFTSMPAIFLITIFLPETLPPHVAGRPIGRPGEPFSAAVVSHLRHAYGRLGESLAMLRQRSVFLLLFTFFLQGPIQITTGQVLAQYISKRFQWKLAQTGYVFSARGVLSVVVLAGLPFLSSRLSSKLHLSTFRRDLVLAQASLLFLVLGSFLTGGESRGAVIAGLVISTLSAGCGSLAKSLIASFVDSEHTARLFTLTEMADTAGSIVAGPTLAWAFDRGMKLGGGWMALPFYFLGLLSIVALVALFFVTPPKGSIRLDEESRSETERNGGIEL